MEEWKESSEATSEDQEKKLIEEGKTAAILGYVPFLCFIPLIKMKDNPFALKHGKQGLVLFLIEIVAVVFLLPKISELFWTAVLILCLVFVLLGILYALQGKAWKIPYIGDWAEKLKI